jgi:putative transposase
MAKSDIDRWIKSRLVQFNTGQGRHFPRLGFPGVLKDAGIAISMGGRGRCLDNIFLFIERLWRSIKYEAVYRHEMTDGLVAQRVIGEWIGCSKTARPHSALDGRTPAEACWEGRWI